MLKIISLTINNARYTIYRVSSSVAPLNDTFDGLTDTNLKSIHLSDDMPNFKEVLLHEIAHAVICEYLLEGNFNWNEELVVTFVQKYLHIIHRLYTEAITKFNNDNSGEPDLGAIIL